MSKINKDAKVLEPEMNPMEERGHYNHLYTEALIEHALKSQEMGPQNQERWVSRLLRLNWAIVDGWS